MTACLRDHFLWKRFRMWGGRCARMATAWWPVLDHARSGPSHPVTSPARSCGESIAGVLAAALQWRFSRGRVAAGASQALSGDKPAAGAKLDRQSGTSPKAARIPPLSSSVFCSAASGGRGNRSERPVAMACRSTLVAHLTGRGHAGLWVRVPTGLLGQLHRNRASGRSPQRTEPPRRNRLTEPLHRIASPNRLTEPPHRIRR